MTIEPIRPDEVQDEFNSTIPDYVVEAFNKHIVLNWNGHQSKVRRDAVMADIIESPNGCTSKQSLFDNHYMDVEDLFRKAGWEVKYDQPSRGENFDPYYIFSKGK